MRELRSVAASYDTQAFMTGSSGAGGRPPGQAADKDTREARAAALGGQGHGGGLGPGHGRRYRTALCGSDGRATPASAPGRGRQRGCRAPPAVPSWVAGSPRYGRWTLTGGARRWHGHGRGPGRPPRRPGSLGHQTGGEGQGAPRARTGRGSCCARSRGWSPRSTRRTAACCGGAPSTGRVRRARATRRSSRVVWCRSLPDRTRLVQALDPATGKARWERDISAYGGQRYVGRHAAAHRRRRDGHRRGRRHRRHEVEPADPGAAEAVLHVVRRDRTAYVASVTGDGCGGAHTGHRGGPGHGGTCGGTPGWRVTWTRWAAQDGVLFLAAIGGAYSDTDAVVRYDPGAGRRSGSRCPCGSNRPGRPYGETSCTC